MSGQPVERKEKARPNTGHVMDEQMLKQVIEALIFAAQKPISVMQIKDIVEDADPKVIRKALDSLKQEYNNSSRSIRLTEIAGGFQFMTDPVYAKWIKKLYNIKQSDYLTGPSLETLAIIAYKQPITRAEIEHIRGVNVDGVVKNLFEKGLIRTAGKKEVVGRPYLYTTTNLFLQYFGLNSLKDLPGLSDFTEADIKLGDEHLVEINKEESNNEEVDSSDKEVVNEDELRKDKKQD